MKLPITDKFLLDLYKIIEDADKIFSLFPKTMIDATNPELFKMRKAYKREKGKRDFRQLVYYLKKKGYIRTAENGALLLTRKASKKVLKMRCEKEGKTKRKDGKWLMIIFDIPEKKRENRDVLRDFLCAMGYERLQDSVWVCAYDVFQQTEELVAEYNLEDYVKIFLVDEIEV